MNQRRLIDKNISLTTYWRQLVTVNLGIITVKCMQSIILLIREIVFSKKCLEKAKISRKKAFFCNQHQISSGKMSLESFLGLWKAKILTE